MCTTLADPYFFTEAGEVGKEMAYSNFNGTVTGVGPCTTLAEPYYYSEVGGVGIELAWLQI